MVKHNNPTISEDAARLFNTKTGDMLGSEVNPIIQPTIELLRKSNIQANITLTSSSASSGIYTTPADKDFYLTSCDLSFIKDAACDINSGAFFIRIYVDGTPRYIGIARLTLTAQHSVLSHDFQVPIKIDRNTTLTLIAGTFTAGSCISNATIIGYTVEVTKGV